MRAAVVDSYGGVERFAMRDVPRPEPGSGQILVRVRAAGVNPIDCKIRQGRLRLVLPARFPLVLGFDVAGEVAAIGPEVTDFEPGDAVFAMLDSRHGGGYAEYAVVGQAAAALKPDALTFEEAAALPVAALTALAALRDLAALQRGDRLAIVGAAGGVGHFAVQLAAALGARVTAVAGPGGGRAELLHHLGAERVVDSARSDFLALDDPADREGDDDAAQDGKHGQDAEGVRDADDAPEAGAAFPYDVIFDAAGVLRFADCELALAPGGLFVTTRRGPASAVDRLRAGLSALVDRRGARHAARVAVRPSGEALAALGNLAAAGRLRPSLSHLYFLDEVAAAHTASETGHTVGKLVLRIDRVAPMA